MENKEFVKEIDVQNKVVTALEGDKNGKSIKGLHLCMKDLKVTYEVFARILVKMVDRGELISRGPLLVLAPPREDSTEKNQLILGVMRQLKDNAQRVEVARILKAADAYHPTPEQLDNLIEIPAPIVPEKPVRRMTVAQRLDAILEFVKSSTGPVTQNQIDYHLVAIDSSLIYPALMKLIGLGKLQRQYQRGFGVYEYSLAPKPKQPVFTIKHKKARPVPEPSKVRMINGVECTGEWEGWEGQSLNDEGGITPSNLLAQAAGSLKIFEEWDYIRFIDEESAYDYEWRLRSSIAMLEALQPIVDAIGLKEIIPAGLVTEIMDRIEYETRERNPDGFFCWAEWLPEWYLPIHNNIVHPEIQRIQTISRQLEETEATTEKLKKEIEDGKKTLENTLRDSLAKIA